MSKAFEVLGLLDEFNVPDKYYKAEIEYRLGDGHGSMNIHKKTVYTGGDINKASAVLERFNFPKKSFGCKKSLWHLANCRTMKRD